MTELFRRPALALACALALAVPAAAQLELRPRWDSDEWIHPDTPIEVEVLAPPEGRLALFLGPTDVTDLFRRRGNLLIYRPELLPLPRGESELVVWEVRPTGWRELGRFPVRVLRRGGFEQAELEVRLDLAGLADVGSGGSDPPLEEKRMTAQLDVRHSAARDGWSLQLGTNVIGVSEIEQALRFGQKGEEADRADLSRWSLGVSRRRFELGLGHLSWGDSRQLIQGFSSRGARLRLPLGRAADLSVAALNGTSIVGWDNLLGLGESEHQVRAATLGVELRPSRPGALRFEVTGLDGSLLPESGFNQGDVNDREENDGWSARVVAAPADRLRLDAAWSESEFTNPFDPLLAQGADLVAVEAETRNARYLDLGWSVLRKQTERGRPLELALEIDHRRVEPLYRSVAAFVQSDVEENAGQLRLLWGGTSGLISHSRSRDNLDELPSVLTTRTGRSAWSFVVPLGELLGGESPSPGIPTFTLSGDRTHQEGDGVPVDGGFSPSHVPDQVNLGHQAGLQWSGAKWNLTASASLSNQDNRQEGRENADFEHRGLGVSLLTSPSQRLDLGIDLRREQQDNEELGEEATTDVLGFNWTLRPTRRLVFTGSLARTESVTEPGIRSSENLVGDAQWAWAFDRRRRAHGVSGRLYLRGAYSDSESTDFLFGFSDRRDGWKLTTGVNLSVN
jgi:hypothetical protein